MMHLLTALAFFQGTKNEGPIWFTMAPFLLLIGAMYFLMLRPQIKEQKKHRGLIDSLKKGDKVITTGGIWGEIDSVEPQYVRVKINDKNKIMVTRSAITGFQPTANKNEVASKTIK